MKNRSRWIGVVLSTFVLALICSLSLPVFALPGLVGPHTYTNVETGDVFLGGNYIELGISKYGSFGTSDDEDVPDGFYATDEDNRIGMSTNPTGFGVEPDLRMDFFMPGTEEERWVVGYKTGELTEIGNSSLLMDEFDIADNAVTDDSSGTTLRAVSIGTFNDALKITQVISFNVGDKFFRNQVTLENIGSNPLDSVRYMRNFDPDNTVYQDGEYETLNQILFTHEAGDGKAVVMADTSNNDEDPVYVANGSRSPIFYYSADIRARVSTFGFSNEDPYEDLAYDSAEPKGTSIDDDQAITITFDVGTLTPDASDEFVYYTSLDNRDFSEVIEEIEQDQGDDGDGIVPEVEDAAPNGGDANNDGTSDSEQSNVTSFINPVTNDYAALATSCEATTEVNASSTSALGITDTGFNYPVGLLDFILDCGTPGMTASITQYFYGDFTASQMVARKYNDVTRIFQTIPGASLTNTVIGGHNALVVSYQITDGSSLDEDGLANGTIVDPSGPALNNVTAPNTGIGGTTWFWIPFY